MMITKTEAELAIMQKNSRMVSTILAKVAAVLQPGITTMQLDTLCAEMIKENGGTGSFYKFRGYPFHICASVNDVVVHGFPNETPLKNGDIVSIDVGFTKNGFVGEHAYTFILGDAPDAHINLVKHTKESLYKGIEKAITGNRVGDIAAAVQEHTEKKFGYGVVRELVGHGLGRSMHEDPQVPNYGKRGNGAKLKENVVLCIEPMINLGTREVFTEEDGWTVRTRDGKPSVHFEHNICVKKNQALILSDYSIIEEAEKKNTHLNTSYY